MTLVLLYLVVFVLVGIVLFALGSVVFGRGEVLPPLPQSTTATVLPASGVTGADVEALKFTQTLRGYKAGEVDWVLDRLGRELDQLRGELAAVRATQGLGAETGTALDGADVSHGADDSRVSDVSGVAEDVQVPDAEWEGR
ncbi:MAG: DivIVA domain-containing protein [Mycobacterium sp.]|nr:DivIVA domain-containing protein [Mycobacterium sp.]